MRKTKVVTIPGKYAEEQGQRDNGNTYLITEMSASQAERWADRAFLCLASSGANLPPGIERTGMAGIAQIAHLVGGLSFAELGPLMDELMGCVQFQGASSTGQPLPRPLIEDDIQEVSTRRLLRQEVLSLHINFSLAAVILNLIAAASDLKTIPDLENASTSRRRSRRSSARNSS